MTDDELREAARGVVNAVAGYIDVYPTIDAALPILRALVARETEACAVVAEKFYGPMPYPLASENTDRYIAQDETCKSIAAAIRARSK